MDTRSAFLDEQCSRGNQTHSLIVGHTKRQGQTLVTNFSVKSLFSEPDSQKYKMIGVQIANKFLWQTIMLFSSKNLGAGCICVRNSRQSFHSRVFTQKKRATIYTSITSTNLLSDEDIETLVLHTSACECVIWRHNVCGWRDPSVSGVLVSRTLMTNQTLNVLVLMTGWWSLSFAQMRCFQNVCVTHARKQDVAFPQVPVGTWARRRQTLVWSLERSHKLETLLGTKILELLCAENRFVQEIHIVQTSAKHWSQLSPWSFFKCKKERRAHKDQVRSFSVYQTLSSLEVPRREIRLKLSLEKLEKKSDRDHRSLSAKNAQSVYNLNSG